MYLIFQSLRGKVTKKIWKSSIYFDFNLCFILKFVPL